MTEVTALCHIAAGAETRRAECLARGGRGAVRRPLTDRRLPWAASQAIIRPFPMGRFAGAPAGRDRFHGVGMTHRIVIGVLAAAMLAVCGCGWAGRAPQAPRDDFPGVPSRTSRAEPAESASPSHGPAMTSPTPGDEVPGARPADRIPGRASWGADNSAWESKATEAPRRGGDEYDPAVDPTAAETAEALRRRYYDKEPRPLEAPDALPELTAASPLEVYVAHAALNDEEMKAAWEHWRWAVGDHFWSWYPPHPYVNYELFVREAEARPGKGRSLYGFSQKFLWIGKLKGRAGVRGETVNAAREAYEAARLKLFYRVKAAYYEYAYLCRAMGILERHREQLGRIETNGPIEESRVNVALRETDERLRACRREQPKLAARLNQALGRAPGAELPPPRWYPPQPVAATDEQLIAWCRQANPELAVLQCEVLRAEHAIYKARHDYYPDLSVGVVAVNTQNAKLPGAEGHTRDHYFTLFSIQMPLWLTGYRDAMQDARMEHWDALRAKVDRQDQVEAEMRKALHRFRDVERQLDPFVTELLPKARQAVSAAAKDIEDGEGTVEGLVDARQVLLEVELAHARTVADYAVRLAEVELLVGRDVPGLEATLRGEE